MRRLLFVLAGSVWAVSADDDGNGVEVKMKQKKVQSRRVTAKIDVSFCHSLFFFLFLTDLLTSSIAQSWFVKGSGTPYSQGYVAGKLLRTFSNTFSIIVLSSLSTQKIVTRATSKL